MPPQKSASLGPAHRNGSTHSDKFRDVGLQGRSYTPHRQPTATPPDIVVAIERMRREHKW